MGQYVRRAVVNAPRDDEKPTVLFRHLASPTPGCPISPPAPITDGAAYAAALAPSVRANAASYGVGRSTQRLPSPRRWRPDIIPICGGAMERLSPPSSKEEPGRTQSPRWAQGCGEEKSRISLPPGRTGMGAVKEPSTLHHAFRPTWSMGARHNERRHSWPRGPPSAPEDARKQTPAPQALLHRPPGHCPGMPD